MLFTVIILTLRFTFSVNTDPMCQYGGTFSTSFKKCRLPMYSGSFAEAQTSCQLVGGTLPCVSNDQQNEDLAGSSGSGWWLANFDSSNCNNKYSQLGSIPDPLACTVMEGSQWYQVNCSSRQPFQCLYSPDSPCQDGWYQIGSSCFVVDSSTEPITWIQAEYHCTSNYSELGAFLTSIHDEENELILTLSKTFTPTEETDIWIGLYREDQMNFKWADGTGIACDVWCNDLPKDVGLRCGSMKLEAGDMGIWYTHNCTTDRFRYFMCRYDL